MLPDPWAQQRGCAGSGGCVSFPTALLVSLFFALSPIPELSNSRRPALEEEAARRMLISGQESQLAGLYHLARRYFTLNDRLCGLSSDRILNPLLWSVSQVHVTAVAWAHRGYPKRTKSRLERETSRLPKSAMHFVISSSKQLSDLRCSAETLSTSSTQAPSLVPASADLCPHIQGNKRPAGSEPQR